MEVYVERSGIHDPIPFVKGSFMHACMYVYVLRSRVHCVRKREVPQ